MWGHSIADTVCRSEVDNAAIVGNQVWELFDPIFGSAIVFFRILSGCLYISLALLSILKNHTEDDSSRNVDERNGDEGNGDERNGDERNGDERNGDERNGDEGNGDERNGDERNGDEGNGDESSDEANFMGVAKFMYSNRNKVWKQTLTISNTPGANTITISYSARDTRFYRNTVRSYYGTIVAVVFAVAPVVAYDTLARQVGKTQKSERKHFVELVLNGLLIFLSGLFIICRGRCCICEWKKELFDCLRNRQQISRCCSSDHECHVCKCDVSECIKQFLRNIEIPVFFIFTIFSGIFYIALAGSEQGVDLATDIVGLFAVILQSVFVFWTALIPNPLNLLLRGHTHHSWNSFFLSLLMATTLGSLAVDIEREHWGPTVHDKPYLRALAPLLVDFRVHAAILTYSVRSEFNEQRFTTREIEEKGIFERVPREPECFRPGCKQVCRNDSDGYWKCTKPECTSRAYCNSCFTDLMVKVGFCPTCAPEVVSNACQTAPPPQTPPSLQTGQSSQTLSPSETPPSSPSSRLPRGEMPNYHSCDQIRLIHV